MEYSFELLADVNLENFSFFDNTLSNIKEEEMFQVLTKTLKEVEPSYLYFL